MSSSVSSGLKSLIASKGRRYYVLEHKNESSCHRAGSSQRIIVDQIEMGRDPRCQVRFDESTPNVSRRHAAIVRQVEGGWKIIHLSQTNATYVNGREVNGSLELNSGDEIRLSANGPRMGFIVPDGDNGLVRSIGMGARITLFRQQAMQPYRKALWILASCMLLAIAAVGALMWMQQRTISEQNETIAQQKDELMAVRRKFDIEKTKNDSMLASLSTMNSNMIADIENRTMQLSQVDTRLTDIEHSVPRVSVGKSQNNAIEAALPYIYYMCTTEYEITFSDGETITIEASDSEVPSWSGTGFMLDDGRFVTARHVVSAWDYWSEVGDDSYCLNRIANNGGRVRVKLACLSSSGDIFEIWSDEFHCDKSTDLCDYESEGKKITRAQLDDTDFAWARVARKGLARDAALSRKLERGQTLMVLGFPNRAGVNSKLEVSPILGSGIVGAPGLTEDGVILTSGTNFEPGNSGGPAIVAGQDGSLRVIGIISAIQGRHLGYIVPISKIQ